jgi:hypothetical protein
VSTYERFGTRCIRCREAFEIPILKGLHITRAPKIYAAIVEDEFQKFACPKCGYVHRVENSTILTDFEKHQYLAVEESLTADWRATKAQHVKVFDDCFTFGPPVAEELAGIMRHRLVFGFQALREKLKVWDAGLDDRAVEAVKGDVLRRRGAAPHAEVLRVSTVLDNGFLLFSRWGLPNDPIPGEDLIPPPALLGHEMVQARAYERRLAHSSEILEDYPWLHDDWVIDLWVTCPTRSPSTRPPPLAAPPGP